MHTVLRYNSLNTLLAAEIVACIEQKKENRENRIVVINMLIWNQDQPQQCAVCVCAVCVCAVCVCAVCVCAVCVCAVCVCVLSVCVLSVCVLSVCVLSVCGCVCLV